MIRQCFSLSASALTWAYFAASLGAAEKPVEGPLQVFLVGKPRMEARQLFEKERHPNIVVTLKGTVLATLGNTRLRARRSEDGGKTWGEEIIVAKPGFQGGGTIVDETTGDILAFAEDHHPPAPLSVYRSRDDGKTWQKMAVTIHPDSRGNVPSMHMNEHGITLRHGKRAGRLIRAAPRYDAGTNHRSKWPEHYTTAIYSDDRGKTWKTSEPFAEMGTGEAAIAELSDGRLYYNSRSHWNEKKPPMRRRCAWSANGGETWTGWQIVEVLPDGPQDESYGCFGGLVRLPIKGKDILLYSNCDSPAHRNHGTVWVSFDGGRTWPLKRLVWEGPFEYSSLAAGRLGTASEGWIYMHFEGRVPHDSHVARFNLSWLMAGKPTGEPFNETYRPQFHYTAKQGWINDPIGLVFYKGQYHLFNDHNPASCRFPGGRTSGEQSHWSHAVSSDLIHWKHLPIAVFPDQHGACWSGSGLVDRNNTAGFQAGEEKALVLLYTSAGRTFTQSLVYSKDRGRTWTKYEKNPVIGHIAAANRDPKVIWHEPTKKWIMALFLDKQDYTLLSSTNLKEWTRICDIPPMGCGECPDFFELPIDGDENNKTWVFWGGNGNYALGSFDGKSFTKKSGPHRSKYGANDYAAQTFSDIPAGDGRRIQISWMSGGKYPNMPFNQQMSFPRVLSLRTTEEGVRLFMEPAKEIQLLHEEEHAFSDLTLKPNENRLKDISGDLFHIVAEFEPGTAAAFGFDIRGSKIEYSVGEETITSLGKTAPLAVKEGKVKLELLVDRTSIELFGSAGRIQMATCFLPDLANRGIGVFAECGEARIVSLKVYELKSAWTE